MYIVSVCTACSFLPQCVLCVLRAVSDDCARHVGECGGEFSCDLCGHLRSAGPGPVVGCGEPRGDWSHRD